MVRNSGRKHDDERSQQIRRYTFGIALSKGGGTCTEVKPNCFESASLRASAGLIRPSYDLCDKHGHLMYAFKLPLQRGRKALPTQTHNSDFL